MVKFVIATLVSSLICAFQSNAQVETPIQDARNAEIVRLAQLNPDWGEWEEHLYCFSSRANASGKLTLSIEDCANGQRLGSVFAMQDRIWIAIRYEEGDARYMVKRSLEEIGLQPQYTSRDGDLYLVWVNTVIEPSKSFYQIAGTAIRRAVGFADGAKRADQGARKLQRMENELARKYN